MSLSSFLFHVNWANHMFTECLRRKCTLDIEQHLYQAGERTFVNRCKKFLIPAKESRSIFRRFSGWVHLGALPTQRPARSARQIRSTCGSYCVDMKNQLKFLV